MVLPRSRSLLADDVEDGDRLFFRLLMLLLALGAGWAALVPVGVEIRAVTARVEPATRVYPVASEATGRVVKVPLALGAKVAAGDPLLVLDTVHETEDLASARANLAELERRAAALEQESREELRRLDLEIEAAAIDEASSARQARGDATAQAYADRHLAQSEKLLEVGLVSKNERLRLEAEAARTSNVADVAAFNHDKNARRLAAAQRSRAVREAALAGSLATLHGQIAEARARVTHLEGELEERTVRSPAAGILRELAVLGPGSVVAAGEKFAKVVPEGPGSVIAAKVDARYLPRLRPGLRATVREIEARPSAGDGSFGSLLAAPFSAAIAAELAAVGVPDEDGDLVPVELRILADRLPVGAPVKVEIELERAPLLSTLLRSLRW